MWLRGYVLLAHLSRVCPLTDGDALGMGGWGVLLYISYIGMCRPKGYGFGSDFVRNRVIDFSFLVWNRDDFARELRDRTCSFISPVILTLTN